MGRVRASSRVQKRGRSEKQHPAPPPPPPRQLQGPPTDACDVCVDLRPELAPAEPELVFAQFAEGPDDALGPGWHWGPGAAVGELGGPLRQFQRATTSAAGNVEQSKRLDEIRLQALPGPARPAARVGRPLAVDAWRQA